MDLALEAGVRYTVPGPRLWFDFDHPDGATARRYIEPYREIVKDAKGHRFWEVGSKAKGSLWFPVNEHETERHVLLLCEGETDALAAVQSKCPYVVACVPGASMTSASINTFCDRYDYDGVICAFDNDDAGNKGAQLLRGYLDTDKYELQRLLPPPGGDLKDWLKGDQPRVQEADWDKISLSLSDLPSYVTPSAKPESIPLRSFRRPVRGDKPDLLAVWSRICPPLPKRPARHVSEGRELHEAFCPLHDDGRNPGAWVGEDRWGCWVCGIESADVYELVAWTRGIVPTHAKLHGQDFARARDMARVIAGDV